MNFDNLSFTNKKKSKADLLDEKQKFRVHGKEMWILLHTSSVYLSEDMNKSEFSDYINFIKSIITFGTKFNKEWEDKSNRFMNKHYPQFNNRDDAILWLCHFHNYVNMDLGKDLFECTKENILKRWGNYKSSSL